MSGGLIQDTIDRFWKARLAGDKAAVRGFLASDATYEMVGAKAFADPAAVGPTHAGPAADQLLDDFHFANLEQVSILIDGPRAAAVNRIEVSFRGGQSVSSEACDLWAFDDAGKVTSLRQFVDTDLVRRMIAGQV